MNQNSNKKNNNKSKQHLINNSNKQKVFNVVAKNLLLLKTSKSE